MFLEGGGWHVTNNPNTGVATKSPRPEPCELDPTVPCATEAEQTAFALRVNINPVLAVRLRRVEPVEVS
jgi:hypothetical protein